MLIIKIYLQITFVIIFLLQVISCSHLYRKPDLNAPIETVPELLTGEEKHTEPDLKKIQIDCDNTCSTEEKENLVFLTELVNKIWWGECFKDYFIQKESFYFTSMRSNEIINALRDSNITTTLSYFYKRKNPFTGSIVIGYENGDGKIHANRYAWAGLNNEEKVSNIIHELTHQKGFKHDGNSYKGNENTVPYQANEAVEACF